MSIQDIRIREHRDRNDLAGEYRFGDAGQMILAIFFLVTWITDSFFFHYSTFVNQYIPLSISIPLGIVFFLLSGYLSLTGLSIVFGKRRQQPSIIRNSVFGIIRHPIYLGEILLYLGFLMLSTSLAAIAIWIVTIGFLYYISRFEEELLLARFGEEYQHYKNEIPMWMPRLHKK
jgi:protein-S-isoprenylcysteine O-methyltransferase Ste14